MQPIFQYGLTAYVDVQTMGPSTPEVYQPARSDPGGLFIDCGTKFTVPQNSKGNPKKDEFFSNLYLWD